MSIRPGFSVVVVLSLALLPVAQAAAGDCGCGAETTCSCQATCARPCWPHHHHRRGNCCQSCQQQPPRSYPTRELPPVGPIMESVPMRMMPVMATQMVAMPAQRVAYVEEPRSRELTCEASSGRIAQLEERFNKLHERVNVLQETMTTQTSILIEIKNRLDKLQPATP